ncbi:DMT family transporter [Oceanobacter antarcticus]|uniref:Multidrug efflux SMR transporter n=1 Tax=Oceanobacter antarcticus TaxID=3133425 RepID=A0ABW8ND38_9GAMM
MREWLFLSVAILGEVAATSALKASDGFSKLTPSVIVIVGYVVAFYFLSLALKSIPIGVAYAVWAGLGVVLVAMAAWVIYDQKLDLASIIGMGFIVVGVIILNVFSKSNIH